MKNRDDLQAIGSRLASGEMYGAAAFMQFLSGSKPSPEMDDILSALQSGAPLVGDEYEAPRELEEYEGCDPWEVDYPKGQSYLRGLVQLLPDDDVHAAYRYIQFVLGRGMGDADAEREAVDRANSLGRRVMTPEERRDVAFHEVGHAAICYWRRESLHERRLILHADRFGGYIEHPSCGDSTESDLMFLLGGAMAELLSKGIVPTEAMRFEGEYRDPNSDTTRIRNVVKLLRGKDDIEYQFEVQERCRAIIEEPRTWLGITRAAERLAELGELDGVEFEEVMADAGALDRFSYGGINFPPIVTLYPAPLRAATDTPRDEGVNGTDDRAG